MRVLRTLPLLLLSLTGCNGWIDRTLAPQGAEVRLEGLGPAPSAIDVVLPYGNYATNPADDALFASDVPLETLLAGGIANGQFLHAQLLWTPKPGNTPVDPTATNVTLRYVLIVDGNVGIYGGAGFAWPSGTPGETELLLQVEGSSMSLLACTDGFHDPLTPAKLTGSIMLNPDGDATRRYRRAVSQIVTDTLGASRWVDSTKRAITPGDALALVFPDAMATSPAGTAVTARVE
ncbi:MAG: hypothetical protein JNM94_14770 [Phycisphaerae bacterium]|nr:hypothetical protein [Phycisphaerae bacterium]